MHIDISRHHDIGEPDRRGWRVDALELAVGGEPAGYLKVAYVPRDRLIALHPPAVWQAISRYAAEAEGVPVAAWRRSGAAVGRPPRAPLDVLEGALRRLEGRLAAHRLGFSPAFCVERPYEDFIRIYDEGDAVRDFPAGVPGGRKAGRSFRRLALAPLLYREGARWMSERGVLLHASDVQAPPARAAWARLREDIGGSVADLPEVSGTRGDGSLKWRQRPYLDGALLPDWAPGWVSSVHVRDAASGQTIREFRGPASPASVSEPGCGPLPARR